MRRPLIIFLVILLIYCWLTDLVNFIYYALHITSSLRPAISVLVGTGGAFFSSWLAYSYYRKQFAGNAFRELFHPDRRREWMLLFIVSLPVILLGLFRSIYPDQNFDTYHFELYLQEFDLTENKLNFQPGAIRTYYFPLGERAFALFRHILGFRLGSILNTVILVTLIFSVYDLLKKYLQDHPPFRYYPFWLTGILSFFIVTADNALFNIGSYKTDLLGIPLLLEMVHILLANEKEKKNLHQLWFFLLASFVIALKLTYLPYAGILCAIWYIRYFRQYSLLEKLLFPLIALIIPGYYMIYNVMETASPIFPFYNKLFHSPFYPVENFKDTRFGPRHLYEIFIYPVVTLLDQERCNEFSLYSFRLLFGYFASWAVVIYYLLNRKEDQSGKWKTLFILSALALAFDYSCVVTTGYYRYGIIIELLYGIVIVLVMLLVKKRWLMILIAGTLIFQSALTIRNIYIKNRNLSWQDYRSLLHNRKALKENAGMILHDHSYGADRDPDKILQQIDGFLSIEPFPYDGLSRMLKKNVPLYDIFTGGRTPDSIHRFESSFLRQLTQQKNICVAADMGSLTGGTIRSLNARGYLVTALHEVYPAFAKVGEPIFLLKTEYLDTARYTIKYTEQFLKPEDSTETRSGFIYNTPHKTITFMRESPWTYAWNDVPEQEVIDINEQHFTSSDRFRDQKIMTVRGDTVKIHKLSSRPYMIMIQDISEKTQ